MDSYLSTRIYIALYCTSVWKIPSNMLMLSGNRGIKKYIKSTDNVSSNEARLRHTNVLKEKDLLKQIAEYLDLSKKDCQHLEITDLVFAHTHDACFKQRVKDERLESISFYNTGGFVKKQEGHEPEWRLLSVLEDGHVI